MNEYNNDAIPQTLWISILNESSNVCKFAQLANEKPQWGQIAANKLILKIHFLSQGNFWIWKSGQSV